MIRHKSSDNTQPDMKRVCAYKLAARRVLRRTTLPVSNPPSRLTIQRSSNVLGDIELSLAQFRELVSHLRSRDVSDSKPVDITTLSSERTQDCVLCGVSLVSPKTRRLHTTCSSCGLKYVSSKSLRNVVTVENDSPLQLNNPKCLYNNYIVVYKDKTFEPRSPNNDNNVPVGPVRARLLVPPPNLYPGDMARRILQSVEDILEALIEKKPVYLDREKQTILTERSLRRRLRSRSDSAKLKERILKKCIELNPPQKAVSYLRIMGCRYIDKCKFGKDNQIRRQCLGRVINGCSRQTVGTSGSLPAGYAVLPSKVLRTLGEPINGRNKPLSSWFLGTTLTSSPMNKPCQSNITLLRISETCGGEGNAIRYPVIDKLNIAYTQFIPSGLQWTAYVPSSQFKYNGGDNDGDAFNSERFTNGLISNSAYENRLLCAPWHDMGNNGQIKMEFDSDAKLGLGVIDSRPAWKIKMQKLRTQFLATGDSFSTYKKFVELEAFGREKSYLNNVLSLQDYAFSLPRGAIRNIVNTEAVTRLNSGHYFHSTKQLGPQRFSNNSTPVKRLIETSLINGLEKVDYICSSQSSVDTLCNQGSEKMSREGNIQYQIQYVLRPMKLSPDRRTVFNPITKNIVTQNVSSLYALNKLDADEKYLLKVALDFARITQGAQPIFLHGESLKPIAIEAAQYKNLSTKMWR